MKRFRETIFRLYKTHKPFAIVNILGLTVAFAICIIAFWVKEYNDNFNSIFHNAENIYAVKLKDSKTNGSPLSVSQAEFIDLSKLDKHKYVFSRYSLHHTVLSTETNVKTGNIGVVDESFFDIFKLKFRYSPFTNYIRANSIILTRELSQHFFGDTNPTGQTIQLEVDEGIYFFVVYAVLDYLPKNNSLIFDAIIPYQAYQLYEYPVPAHYDAVFFSLKAGVSANELAKIPKPFTYIKFKDLSNTSLGNGIYKFNQVLSGQTIRTCITAVLILLLSLFTFIISSIALYASRTKEILVRKVSGASQFDILIQFLLENLSVLIPSLLISLFCSNLFISIYNEWMGELVLQINYNLSKFYFFLLSLGIGSVVIGSIYPVAIIYGLKVQNMIRTTFQIVSRRTLILTRLIFSFQISVNVYFLFLVFVFVQNYNFRSHIDRGFETNNILNVKLYTQEQKDALLVKVEQERREGRVLKVASTTNLIGFEPSVRKVFIGFSTSLIPIYSVTPEYVDLLKIKLLRGRWMVSENEVVINEAFFKTFHNVDSFEMGGGVGKIVGVIKNFVISDSRKGSLPTPTILVSASSKFPEYLCVETTGLSGLGISLLDVFQPISFGRHFIESQQSDVEVNDAKLNFSFIKLNFSFTLIALLFSSTSLFAINRMTIKRKQAEIGIRKIFGAGFHEISTIIHLELIVPILIAYLLGITTAYYASKYFLSNVFDLYYEVGLFDFVVPLIVIVILTFVISRVLLIITTRKSAICFSRIK